MKKTAPVLVLAAGTLWGMMGIFVRKLGTYGFSSIQIASLRVIFGALIFLVMIAIWKRDLLKIKIRDIGLFLGMGLVSLLLFTICYFTTINIASLSAAAILLYTSPIWVMLMSLVCFKEKMTKRKVLAVALAFGGCILVSGIGGDTQLSAGAIGIGLMSAVGYGLYSILGTYALRKYPPLTVTAYAFLCGGIGAVFVCDPVDIVDKIQKSAEPGFLIALILITAFVTAVLPYFLYTVGLSAMRASSAAIMASIEPVVATVAGVAVFHETMTAVAFIGILLVLGAIVVLNLRENMETGFLSDEMLERKKKYLEKYLKSHAPLAVAYSGGVDSALLLKIASETLEKEQVVAVMATGPMIPKSEADFAEKLAKQMECEFLTFQADVLGVEEFAANGPRRCYYCKKYLFTKILAVAKEHGCMCVVDGTNVDDVKDYRPGRQALMELGVKSPFLEAGLTKDEIRKLSGYYGLSTAKKPAMACLATRIPTGTVITGEKLQKIEAGEEILKSIGLKQYRLRLLGETGRIECLKEEIPRVQNCWNELEQRLKQAGFANVELNPEGYGCGNMNVVKEDLQA